VSAKPVFQWEQYEDDLVTLQELLAAIGAVIAPVCGACKKREFQRLAGAACPKTKKDILKVAQHFVTLQPPLV
jgi:hypothetical protein